MQAPRPPTHAFALALGLVAAGVVDGVAAASPRYAIVIGSNLGEPDEPALRFAERDAQRVTEVLTRLGGFAPEDVLTLLTPTADEVTRALASYRSRLAQGEPGAMVLVYYSGHADERALHLSGTRYRFERLKAEVRTIGAELSLFLIDACRSGGIVRAKGATPTEPFTFDVRDEIAAEGTAIITSSAEDEDAQESDRLEGGVFTHHLVTGLLGAADRSGDDRVSLTEAYRYVYAQTIAATSATSIVQHPTYAFEVQGHNEIVLTRLGDQAGRGRLRLAAAGHYLVFERGGGGDIVAELDAEAGTSLWMKPGRYLVRLREAAAAYERVVHIQPEQTTLIEARSLERVPFRHAVRKGYGLQAPSLSLGAIIEGSAPVLDETGIALYGALALQVDFADLALQARLRVGRGATENERVAMTTTLFGADVGLFHLFDLGEHGVGFGLRGGLDWLAQRFETSGEAPPVDQLVGRVAPIVRAEIALGASATLTLDVGVDIYFLQVASLTDGMNYGSTLAAHSVGTANVGLSVALP